MYSSFLRLYVEASPSTPLLGLGLFSVLMASWGLIVIAIAEIVVRVFDVPDER